MSYDPKRPIAWLEGEISVLQKPHEVDDWLCQCALIAGVRTEQTIKGLEEILLLEKKNRSDDASETDFRAGYQTALRDVEEKMRGML